MRDGKAVIIEERCIDCGECIRTCPNNAKTAFGDGLAVLTAYDYRIALPAPSLFGQFKHGTSPGQIIAALHLAGFDDVYEVAEAADYLTCVVRNFLSEQPFQTWISSSCPAVVRLIQVRFPELLTHLLPLDTPMELAAQLAKASAAATLPKQKLRVGAFFITPCPAKTTAVYQPEGNNSHVDGTISIAEIYGPLLHLLPNGDSLAPVKASRHGLGWALPGGEGLAVAERSQLCVAGIHEVCVLLEELEQGRLEGVHYIEAQSCPGGCLGGPLTVVNSSGTGESP
ncbi:MAG: Periplasmic (Fe) hydrogenase large subunit [Firmicutes bacterium]|nr:Periplasmic (Fe) hydrogenase large subunit [Bacillota bacterium]